MLKALVIPKPRIEDDHSGKTKAVRLTDEETSSLDFYKANASEDDHEFMTGYNIRVKCTVLEL